MLDLTAAVLFLIGCILFSWDGILYVHECNELAPAEAGSCQTHSALYTAGRYVWQMSLPLRRRRRKRGCAHVGVQGGGGDLGGSCTPCLIPAQSRAHTLIGAPRPAPLHCSVLFTLGSGAWLGSAVSAYARSRVTA